MAFKQLEEFFDASITLPINGKDYEIQSPDAETGIFCQRLMAGAATVMTGQEISDKDAEKLRLDDDEESDLYQRLLGSVWDELFADQVPWTLIKHAGSTALVWVTQSREDAEEFWSQGPKKDPAAPQDRKAPAKKTATPRKSASSRKTSSGDPRKRTATPGRSSSTTGRSSKPTSPTEA